MKKGASPPSHTLSCAGFRPGLFVLHLGPTTRVRTHTEKLPNKGINSALPSRAAFLALPIRGQKKASKPLKMDLEVVENFQTRMLEVNLPVLGKSNK